MANSWFRMYAEWLDDAKVQMLTPEMQRHHVALLCLRCQQPTEKMTQAQIAFRLRVDETFLQQIKAVFLKAGFIDENWAVINWNKRQFVSDSSTPRVQRFRERQALKRDETLQKQPETQNETGPDTEQNRNRSEQRKAARGTRLSPDFKPTDAHRRLATDLGVSIREELQKFRDHWRAKAGREAVKVDWDAAFNNWLRKAPQFIPRGGQPRTHPTEPCPVEPDGEKADPEYWRKYAADRQAKGLPVPEWAQPYLSSA